MCDKEISVHHGQYSYSFCHLRPTQPPILPHREITKFKLYYCNESQRPHFMSEFISSQFYVFEMNVYVWRSILIFPRPSVYKTSGTPSNALAL